MNRGPILAIAVLVVLLAGLVWYSRSMEGPAGQATTATTSPEATTSTAATSTAKAYPTAKPVGKGVPDSTTYRSLLTQTGSYECDYNGASEGGQTSNVIYMYGGKMRGEFRTFSPGQTTANLFVYDGHYMYQWKEGTSVGTRTVLTSLSQLPLVIPKNLTSGGIIGDSYTSVGWQCHSWLTNKSLLTPPSYVTFQ